MEISFDINLWIVLPNGPCLHGGYAPEKKSYCFPWKTNQQNGLQTFSSLNPTMKCDQSITVISP